ncbi:hypothetical protein DSO57_1004697 [Entomophthora muscae]|uniref:Uncharacterized protein n=2 Tax=Entomophthora muscae TaxID=34485 RepID=A0ACC2S1D9_9FUNG|nr:hypothetical protein DSO57_1036403 [Entomophthora muscae]KAJ9066934.1 hypothetical protein DSO57_1004697 [Entomophthora muscae]
MTTHALARGQLAPILTSQEDSAFSHSYATPPSSTHIQSEGTSHQASNPSSFDPLAHPPHHYPQPPLNPVHPPMQTRNRPTAIEPQPRSRAYHPYSIASIMNPIHERPRQATPEHFHRPLRAFSCDLCGCTFKQSGCRYKHQWEDSSYWKQVQSLSIPKAQQIAILEAAHTLVEISASKHRIF